MRGALNTGGLSDVGEHGEHGEHGERVYQGTQFTVVFADISEGLLAELSSLERMRCARTFRCLVVTRVIVDVSVN